MVRFLSMFVLVLSLSATAVAQSTRSPASDLMKRRLYRDAIAVLQKEIASLAEAEAGKKFLMLGECHYLLKAYADARPYFVKAKRNLPGGKDKVVAEYRLACIAYRMADEAGAIEQTDLFVRKHPLDRRSGTLQLYKMQALAKRGASAIAEVEALRESIKDNTEYFGIDTGMAADKGLTDFYQAIGQGDKAKSIYQKIVYDFRGLVQDYTEQRRTVPDGLRQARDFAAMQLANISLAEKNQIEAQKWLDMVAFDPELIASARLMMAQMAYQARDYRKAEKHLLGDGYIETVPAGKTRSDMYLLLGFCAKKDPRPTLEKVVGYFSKVDPNTKAYGQAQMGIADTYRRWRRPDDSIKAYHNATSAPKYEPEALSHLGTLYMEKAKKASDKTKRDAAHAAAAEALNKLTTKYPSTRYAKDAADLIKELLGYGLDVELATSDEEVAAEWEKAVSSTPGSAVAARALINLARLHHKAVIDEDTGEFVTAPDYPACVHACNRLLDAKFYTGKDLPPVLWGDMQVEALYYRAMSHVASAARTAEPAGKGEQPTYLKGADVAAAIADLTKAQETVDATKQRDLAKNIEIGLVEAMFKSTDAATQAAARDRFEELVATHGSEPRFQKLAMELAGWYHDQKRYAEAAAEYRAIADRSTDMATEGLLELLFMAGKLNSHAANAARKASDERRFAIYIYPREVVALGGIEKTHEPLKKRVRLRWPAEGGALPAAEALALVSQAAEIPFVWSTAGGEHSVAAHLASQRVQFDDPSGPVIGFVRRIIDPAHHSLAFDIGLADGKPTIEPATDIDVDDPEAADAARVIEIIHEGGWADRYKPLTQPYGTWGQKHGNVTMMFNVLENIERISGTTIQWADGVAKEDIQAAEFRTPPTLDPAQNHSCARVLADLLDSLNLSYRIVPRDVSDELYAEAKDCFNDIRKIAPKSPYGEKSLFLLALNFYQQRDYERMKIVLKEYLKVFDSPSFDHYHEACFWVGWVFEEEKRLRDACRYYNTAAAERLVIYRLGEEEEPPSREAILARMGYETAFSLAESVNGTLTNSSLETGLADFTRLHTGIELRMDAAAMSLGTNVNRVGRGGEEVIDVLLDVLTPLGLSLRAENLNEEIAEKAYYRMASAYQRDGLVEQALASCETLLDRYPNTRRKKDAYKLRLDIYKALKDYRNVLATLGAIKAELGDHIEAYKIDFEMAWIYFDLCRYAEAVDHFKKSLAAATAPGELLRIRDGYARALFLNGDLDESLAQYKALVPVEKQELRAFIAETMSWYLARASDRKGDRAMTAAATALMRKYEALDAEGREQISAATLAKVTWIYYVTALLDLKDGAPDRALQKLEAAGNSPDDWLAADAMHRSGLLHMKGERYKQAAEAFEYLLFSTKSPQAEIKASYALGHCLKKLGRDEASEMRFNHVLKKFPDSSYADKVRDERERAKAAAEAAAVNATPASATE